MVHVWRPEDNSMTQFTLVTMGDLGSRSWTQVNRLGDKSLTPSSHPDEPQCFMCDFSETRKDYKIIVHVMTENNLENCWILNCLDFNGCRNIQPIVVYFPSGEPLISIKEENVLWNKACKDWFTHICSFFFFQTKVTISFWKK